MVLCTSFGINKSSSKHSLLSPNANRLESLNASLSLSLFLLWVKIRLNISDTEEQIKSTFLICCKLHWKWQSLVQKHLWFPSNVNPRHPITINRRFCSRTLQSDPTCLHFLLKTTKRINLKCILHVKDKPQQCQYVLALWKKNREKTNMKF